MPGRLPENMEMEQRDGVVRFPTWWRSVVHSPPQAHTLVIDTCTHVSTHRRTLVRHTHTCVHTHHTHHSHTHPHVSAHTPDTCMHICVQYAHTHTMHTHTQAHVSTCRHTWTHVYKTHTHMQAYRHRRVHTRTHTDSCFATAVTFIFSGETATWGDVLGVHTSGCPGTS